MEKISKIAKPIISALLLTGVIIGALFVVVGFIAYLINVVCLNPTTVFQRTAFIIAFITICGVAWFCLSGKE